MATGALRSGPSDMLVNPLCQFAQHRVNATRRKRRGCGAVGRNSMRSERNLVVDRLIEIAFAGARLAILLAAFAGRKATVACLVVLMHARTCARSAAAAGIEHGQRAVEALQDH